MSKTILLIIVAVVLTVVASVFVWMLVVGDKPRPESKILYLGPKKISELSDKEYTTTLSKAKSFEDSGNIADAIKQYEHACKINRFVMPSYYPLLDVARLKCKQGDKPNAINTLKSFMIYAEDEVNPTPKSSFIIEDNSNDQIEYVKKLIVKARELLKVCADN